MWAGAWGNSPVCGDELGGRGRGRLSFCNDERSHDGRCSSDEGMKQVNGQDRQRV